MLRTEINLAKIGEKFPWFAFLATVLGFLMFSIILFSVYVPSRPGFVDEERVQERLHILKEIEAKSQKLSTRYGWVESQPGTVRIPIEHAMDLIVREYANPVSN